MYKNTWQPVIQAAQRLRTFTVADLVDSNENKLNKSGRAKHNSLTSSEVRMIVRHIHEIEPIGETTVFISGLSKSNVLLYRWVGQ